MSEPFNYTRLELVTIYQDVTTEGIFYVDDAQEATIRQAFEAASPPQEQLAYMEELIGRDGVLPSSIISRDANNEAHGKYRIFGKNGLVVELMHHRHGVPHGPFGMYDDDTGKPIDEGHYEDGEIHGLYTSYAPAGENPTHKRYEHGMRIFGSFVPELG